MVIDQSLINDKLKFFPTIEPRSSKLMASPQLTKQTLLTQANLANQANQAN